MTMEKQTESKCICVRGIGLNGVELGIVADCLIHGSRGRKSGDAVRKLPNPNTVISDRANKN